MKKHYLLSVVLALSFLWTNAQDIVVSGADNSDANGIYSESGTYDGKTRWENSNGWFIRYDGGVQVWEMDVCCFNPAYYSEYSLDDSPDLADWSGEGITVELLATYAGGDGTSVDPYQIANLDQLELLSESSADWDKYFIQTADINAAATEDWNSSDGFSPIGNSTTKFTGNYNGQGYTIDSLFITSSGVNKGMFGYCNGAEIKNLNLFDVTLTVDERNVGLLAGRVEASTIIDSVNTSGTINSTYSGGTWASPGGIVGRLDASTLSNSSADVSITSLAGTTGGLVGYTSSSSTITKCYSTGTINQNGIYHGAGGIVGSTDGTANDINNCYSDINITGINWTTTDDDFDGLGGLIGRVQGSLVTVDNCYSFGSVSSNMATTSRISGLIGVNENADDSNITNCYWDTETSGQASSDGGTGKTTTEMKTEDTFTSWDFASTWSIRSLDSISYPYLQAVVQNPAPGIEITPYAGGDGTEGDPYQIANIYQLELLSNSSSDWDKYFIQTADINASATSGWNSNAGFSPIGNSSTNFTGTYNGQGYSIDSLTIDRSATSSVGMFGQTADGAVIKKLNLVDVDITGSHEVGALVGTPLNSGTTTIDSVTVTGSITSARTGANAADIGGLVGWARATTITNSSVDATITGEGRNIGGIAGDGAASTSISNCYVNGSITATGTQGQVGGIAGLYRGSGIEECYSTASVTAGTVSTNVGVGGLVGELSSGITVSNSYASGAVDHTSGATLGGLIGVNGNADDSNVTNSYWDTETSGQASSDGGTGKTTTEMKTEDTFTSWDFDATWSIRSLDSISYPYLQAVVQNPAPGIEITSYDGGDGTSGDPYQIATLSQLYKLSNDDANWDKYFIQTADINASATSGWNSNEGFSPIGNNTTEFTGTYNGQNNTIDSLFIDRSAEIYQGLFGYKTDGELKNIVLTNVDITGSAWTGGLVGRYGDGSTTAGLIFNCSVTGGTVTATFNGQVRTGGLAGLVSGGINVSNSNTNVVVAGEERLGGLIGEITVENTLSGTKGIVSSCYALGNVDGTARQSGGLIGYMNINTRLNNSYAIGDVAGTDVSTGGLVGYTNTGTVVESCYATGDVTGGAHVGGLIGYNRAVVINCYSTGSASGTSSVGGFMGTLNAGSVSDCFWDTETSGSTTSAAGTGKNTAQMKVEATFTNWGFINTWNIRTTDSVSYPYFRYMVPAVKPGIEVATYTWVGIDTAWSNTDNWLTGSVPGSGDDVTIEATDNDPVISNAPASPAESNNLTIDASATLTIDAAKSLTVNGDLTNNGTLTLESGATIITDGTVGGSGTNTVQQDLDGSSRNYYIGSPVSGATGVVFDNSNESKFYHDASDQRYYTLADGDVLKAAFAYVYRSADANTLSFSGSLNTGAVSNTSLLRVGTDNPYRGYNLVSNPYPSYVDWKLVTKTNLEATMWYRTHDGANNVFDTYNATSEIGTNNNGGGAVDEFIPPMQGFWVRVDADGNTGQIAFDNTMRSHQVGSIESVNDQGVFRFVINSNGTTDESIVVFNDNAQPSFEDYDSRKMYSTIDAQVATVVEGEDAVINGLPYQENTSVPVKITVKKAGVYTLTANEKSGGLENTPVYLKDKKTDEFMSFNAGESYSFEAQESDSDRFELHFGLLSVSTEEVTEKPTLIYANNSLVTVAAQQVEDATATIFNMAGQQVYTQQITNNFSQFALNVPSGVYVVQFTNNGATNHQRIFIK